jgi:hypothetical protein
MHNQFEEEEEEEEEEEQQQQQQEEEESDVEEIQLTLLPTPAQHQPIRIKVCAMQIV